MLTSRAQAAALPHPGVRPISRGVGWLTSSFTVAGALWALLFLAISASPWTLTQTPKGLLGHVHFYRAAGPLLALGVVSLVLLARATIGAGPALLGASLRPWLGYGLLALGGALTSPNVTFALWWGAAYLACVLVAWAYVDAPTPHERLQKARNLNYWTWALALGLFLVLLYISRGVLFTSTDAGLSGYGISNRVRSYGGVTMVRASGFARSASIPALFAFVLVWKTRGWRRLVATAVVLVCTGIVVLMQSRGATASLFGGFAFAMLFMGRRSRQLGMLILLGMLLVMLFGAELGVDTERARTFLNREEEYRRTDVELMTSGRTRDWGIAMDKILESPFWGWGPQADRFFFGFHVHNTYLYAWLAAGLFGLLFLLQGFIRAWRALWRGARDGVARALGVEVTMIQVGCLLAFFTLRSIPEVSGAMFGIDLMLLVPVMAWLSALEEARLEAADEGATP